MLFLWFWYYMTILTAVEFKWSAELIFGKQNPVKKYIYLHSKTALFQNQEIAALIYRTSFQSYWYESIIHNTKAHFLPLNFTWNISLKTRWIELSHEKFHVKLTLFERSHYFNSYWTNFINRYHLFIISFLFCII